jgi:hypothetical protein
MICSTAAVDTALDEKDLQRLEKMEGRKILIASRRRIQNSNLTKNLVIRKRKKKNSR